MDKGNLDQRQQAIMDRLEHEMAEDASNIAACDGAAKLDYFRTSPGALISWLATALRADLPRSFEAARGTFHLSTLPLGSIRAVDDYTQVLTMTGNFEYATDDPDTSRRTWPQEAIIFSARDIGSTNAPLVEFAAVCKQQIVIPYLDHIWSQIQKVYKPESVPDQSEQETTPSDASLGEDDWLAVLDRIAEELKEALPNMERAKRAEYITREQKPRIKQAWKTANANRKGVSWVIFEQTVMDKVGFRPEQRTVNGW